MNIMNLIEMISVFRKITEILEKEDEWNCREGKSMKLYKRMFPIVETICELKNDIYEQEISVLFSYPWINIKLPNVTLNIIINIVIPPPPLIIWYYKYCF